MLPGIKHFVTQGCKYSNSPDLSPANFHLFTQLDKSAEGRKFSFKEDVIEAVEERFGEKDKHSFFFIFERSRNDAGSL